MSHPSATKVLVDGRAVIIPAGRSDDYVWPRRGIAPFNTDPAVATTTDPLPVMRPTAVATVPVPTVEARPVGTSNQRRSSRTAQTQRQQPQRRNTQRSEDFQSRRGFQDFPFFR
jgi:hypothetical protein